LLRPVHTALAPKLAMIFRDSQRAETERNLATSMLVEYASDDPVLLADLLMDADSNAYVALFPVAERLATETLPLFQAELQKKANLAASATDPEQIKERLAERQARAAVTLIRLDQAESVWPVLRHSADPRLRSFILNWLQPLGADPHALVVKLDGIDPKSKPAPAQAEQVTDAILFDPETSIRRVLILALGSYGTGGLSSGEREALTGKLFDLYCSDPDAGIHGAAEWTLRQWKQEERLKSAQAELRKLKDKLPRRWFVNSQGQAFAVIDGPVDFRMGSPGGEPDRNPSETPHHRVISRRFAIAGKEVTVEQYDRFARENPQFGVVRSDLDKYSPDPNGPMIAVSWFGAAAYCNWLSKQEGLPQDQWCYLPNERGEYDVGMTIPADAFKRTGYRLPAEAEWEYACRAGTVTSRYHGLSIGLLDAYARYAGNSKEHAWPGASLLPNDLGVFDMLGNACEWCQERYATYQPGTMESTRDDILDIRIPRLVRGGSFIYPPAYVRSAYRDRYAPTDRNSFNGFRLARTYRGSS
jgi:eukaryotic-like serine/threonine-protein kinase